MPTRKQQSEQDAKQRLRVRREIKKNIDATLGRAFSDAMARLKAIRPEEWAAAQAEDELVTQAGKGKGPGRGWWGPQKGGTHGAPSGGGAGGAGGELIEDVTADQLRSWNRQIATWEGSRRDMAVGAIETLMEENTAAFVIERDGQLKGLAAVRKPTGASEYKDSLYLEYLATGERGFGYPMMRGMASQAVARNNGLSWYAVPGSQAFYEKIGFKPKEAMPWGGADFSVSHSELTNWLDTGVQVHSIADTLEEIADLEPESGVFAMPKEKAVGLAAQADGKGPGKGWHGPPKGTHGATLGRIPGHVWERAQQRTGYKAVRSAIRALKANAVLPSSRDQQWHMPLKRDGQTVGYLVGADSFAQTVLGARMRPKAGSVEVEV